ncbi:hypothetical protein [Catenuloplanes indicus]|uniref:Uncharacterized protein n=1 Tax=Catenuloplanes indicus TaxID=137267 RepID=A0AAE3VXU0_9ACTN|nr:hypothetical protein [Catenuloplanes indicus]MDQ0365675.1 hypothetical protein [Catenuloplanes indicus]
MYVSSQSTVLAPARLRGGFGAYRGTTSGTRRHQLPRPPRQRTSPGSAITESAATGAPATRVEDADRGAATIATGATAPARTRTGTAAVTGDDPIPGTPARAEADTGWFVHPFVD